MDRKSECINLEKVAEIIIETIKELNSAQRPVTSVALREALARRRGFAELSRPEIPPSYRDLGPRTGKRDPIQAHPQNQHGNGATHSFVAPLFAQQTQKLKDFRFELLNESLNNLTNEHLARASELRECVRNCDDPDRLLEMNQDILMLLQVAFRKVGGEIEQFTHLVQEIGKNLVEMEAEICSSSSTSRETFYKNKDFNNLLEQNVREITDSIHISRNLKDIKEYLASKFEGIRLGIEQKRRQDELQLSKAQKEIDRLKRHLRQMKDELSRVQTEAQSLEKEVLLDPLTGIHNRRAYEKHVKEEFSQYRSNGRVFSMLLIDIDHFKQVNDQFGHWAGDRCLVEFTKLVRHTLRGADFLARYGGEEFIALLPGTDEQGIVTVSEKIRQVIERAQFMCKEQIIPITISIGGTHVRPEDDSPETIFNRVDAALYKAKQSGRNRVVLL